MATRIGLLVCLFITTGALEMRARNEIVVFAIGLRIARSPNSRGPSTSRTSILFRAGTSTPADWPAYQPGTFDATVGRSTDGTRLDGGAFSTRRAPLASRV